MLAKFNINADPWAFHAHPEVWLLVVSIIAAYVYAIRVIGPSAVPAGTPVVTRRQLCYFVGTIILLEGASDWPIHDIGETYLYSVHMVQHMILAYFLPPLALLAMPEWLMRLIIGNGKTYRVVRFMTKPVVAGVLFNMTVMVTHIPGVVNASGTNAVLHYSLHFMLVTTSLLMWMPVVGPLQELRMRYTGKMVYLFCQSVIPTVPAGWLTFAEGVVYKHYNIPVRLWGLSPQYDQQIAGGIMKVGGTFYLWAIIIYIFFHKFGAGFDEDQSYRRKVPRARSVNAPDATVVEPALTYEQVTEAFGRTPAAPEPERTT